MLAIYLLALSSASARDCVGPACDPAVDLRAALGTAPRRPPRVAIPPHLRPEITPELIAELGLEERAPPWSRAEPPPRAEIPLYDRIGPPAETGDPAEYGQACGNDPADYSGDARTGSYSTSLQGLRSQVWVPEDYTPDQSYPILIHMHGTTSNSAYNSWFFPSHELVDDLGFIQVMPNAPATMWSWVSDQTVEEIIDEVAAEYNVDRRRIYIGGHSQGGMKALSFASNTDTAAAVLPYAGWGGGPVGDTSLFNFHGRTDLLVSPLASTAIHGAYLSAHGCEGAGSAQSIHAGGNDITGYVAEGCEGGTEVRMYWEDTSGHMARWSPEFLEPVFEDLLEVYHPDGCQ